MFSTGSARLLYDSRLDQAVLGLHEPLVASVNRLADRQTTRQYFLYTRNRGIPVALESESVTIVTEAGEIEGAVSSEIVGDATHWISFEGTRIFRCGNIRVHRGSIANTVVRANAESSKTVESWIPRFEASRKHNVRGYTSRRGIVSPMDLTEKEAQHALAHSIKHQHDERYGYCRQAFYAFYLTRTDGTQTVFHGFRVSEDAVPNEARQSLLKVSAGL
jgi:hypothetical protein